MFCKNCGNQIPDGVRFCPKCGKVTGAVLSNQSAINQNAANKNLMGHTATGCLLYTSPSPRDTR